ncbi:MAG: hypothetical protein AAF216_10440 [Pseudomonadota bacterium]
MIRKILVSIATCAVAACATPPDAPATSVMVAQETTLQGEIAHVFMGSIRSLCGQAFEGAIVSDDPQDEDWRAERLVMHVADCQPDEIQVPLHVGDDRSRTWYLTYVDRAAGENAHILLRHRHLHEDGSSDVLTGYGGASSANGTPFRQEFPAGAETKQLFTDENIPDSRQNTWAIEVRLNEGLFAYEMSRPGRIFRVEFDITTPVETPPPAWGADTFDPASSPLFSTLPGKPD